MQKYYEALTKAIWNVDSLDVLPRNGESVSVQMDDPIVADRWSFVAFGEQKSSQIVVGRPGAVPGDPDGTWFCPVFIEHRMAAPRPVYGSGPVDSLMNAMRLVSMFFHEWHSLSTMEYSAVPRDERTK